MKRDEFMNLKGSKTEENLMRAFAGESQARSRYTIAAEVAKKNKMYVISDIFTFTADQERAHADKYYKLLNPVAPITIDINGTYPVGSDKDVLKMLMEAEHNETEEYDKVYPSFGNEARAEGFPEIAEIFYGISEIEKIHSVRFNKIHELLTTNTFYEAANGEDEYMCTNCGHIHKGKSAPAVCPICQHVKGFFIPTCLAPYMPCCSC